MTDIYDYSDEPTVDYEFLWNDLADRVNALNDCLTTSNIELMINDSKTKLDQWRSDSHQLIDRFYERKCREYDQHVSDIVDKQRKEINRIRSTLAVLVHKRDFLPKEIQNLSTNIEQIEREIAQIKNKYLQLDVQMFEINENLIRIQDLSHQYSPSIVSPPCRSMNYIDDSSKILAANDRHLLIHHNSKLCLVDQDLNIVKEKVWNNGWVMDMCWSSLLARFFVLTRNYLFLIDESSMSIVRVQKLPKLTWWSCTCSETFLYVTTKDWACDIHQLSLWPSIQSVKRWSCPETCQEDETINNLVSHKEHLAMMIYRRSTKSKSIDLRLASTLQRLWSIDLDIDYDSRAIRCSLLNQDDWLVVDWNTSHVYQITTDGKFKFKSDYNPSPSSATMFGANLLAISTAVGIHLHKL